MRFVWAVAAFIVAAVMIGAGVAQRTIFQGPADQSATIQTQDDTSFTLVDGAVLNSVPGTQTISVEGDGPVYVAYGRTLDVRAWLGDREFTDVGVVTDAEGRPEIVSTVATPDPDVEAGPDERTPVGSDLWLDEFQQEDRLTTPLSLREDMSVLVASDGVDPAPAEITVTWPADTSTPWAGPLIAGGSIVLAIGIVLYVLGIRHVRRSRRPRRKGLPLPPTEPIDLAVSDGDKGVISSGTPSSRRSLNAGRRRLVAVPALGVSAVLLAGCTADAWPQFSDSPTPTPTATIVVPEGQQQPAVSQAQAERIVERIAETVAEADAAMDPGLAATRLAGVALAERETNYTLRAAIAEQTPLPPIPADELSIVLPQAFDEWPRSVMTVAESGGDSTAAPTIMLLTQENPWSEYKVTYIANLEASIEMPDLAAPYVGAIQVPPASSFLAMPPESLAAAYADLIDNGSESVYWSQFDTEGDSLLPAIQANRQERTDRFNETAEGTGTMSFESTAGPQPPFALATLDSGAIVAVNVLENDTVRSTNPDAVIKLEESPTVQALTGVDQSATGFTTTYTDQLFFYLPGQNSNEKIRLLGYRSHILEARVIP